MFKKIKTASIKGMEVIGIDVEVDISDGLPVIDMVGLLGSDIKESKERVRTALKNTKITIPPKRITVSLSPANIRKRGSYFDLPIAVGIIFCLDKINTKLNIEEILFAGELSLDGSVREVNGALLIALYAKENNYKYVVLPKKNEDEGAVVEGINIIGVECINDLIKILNSDDIYIKDRKSMTVLMKEFSDTKKIDMDFSDIYGQNQLKRASLIAAAGRHNIIFAGPPGSGKSMAAGRINSILPDPDLDECMEISKIYSIAGLLEGNPLITKRPFRAPHHTITDKAMIGGGILGKPGEITLSHLGVLFLDELAEFKRETIESLRQPIENNRIVISRTSGNYVFPSDVLFVGATNLCKCGFYPDKSKCKCTEYEVNKYLLKISGPFLDRMDLCVSTPSVLMEDLIEQKKGMSSEEMKKIVLSANLIQKDRFKNYDINYNSEIGSDEIKKFCYLGESEKNLLRDAYAKFNLSARGYYKTIRVARTIADIEGSLNIKGKHIAEAIGYKTFFTKRFL